MVLVSDIENFKNGGTFAWRVNLASLIHVHIIMKPKEWWKLTVWVYSANNTCVVVVQEYLFAGIGHSSLWV